MKGIINMSAILFYTEIIVVANACTFKVITGLNYKLCLTLLLWSNWGRSDSTSLWKSMTPRRRRPIIPDLNTCNYTGCQADITNTCIFMCWVLHVKFHFVFSGRAQELFKHAQGLVQDHRAQWRVCANFRKVNAKFKDNFYSVKISAFI